MSIDCAGKSKKKFCWYCHLPNEDVGCKFCDKVYHYDCLKSVGLEIVDLKCPECEKLEKENNEKTLLKELRVRFGHDHEEKFHYMLKTAFKRLKFNEKLMKNLTSNLYRNIINDPLFDIKKKIKEKSYISLEQLIQELKSIVHECYIHDKKQINEKSKLLHLAVPVFEFIQHELNEMSLCIDCYLSSIPTTNSETFTQVCMIPHLLVFAKFNKSPYWPAKIIKTNDDDKIDVRFFGTYNRALVPAKNCYWVSEKMINTDYKKKNLNISVEEAKIHIQKLEKVHGTFCFAESSSLVDLKKPFVYLEKFRDQTCLKDLEIPDDFLFKTKKSLNKKENKNSARNLHKRKTTENDQDNSAEMRIKTWKQTLSQNRPLKKSKLSISNETSMNYDNVSTKLDSHDEKNEEKEKYDEQSLFSREELRKESIYIHQLFEKSLKKESI